MCGSHEIKGFIRFLVIGGLRIQCSPHITFGNPHSLHPHIHIHAQTHINAYMHKYLYASMHKHMSMHTCTWTGLYTHTYICTHTSHINTHSCTHTHIYTYTSKWPSLLLALKLTWFIYSSISKVSLDWAMCNCENSNSW